MLAGCSSGGPGGGSTSDAYYGDLVFGTPLDYSTATCGAFDAASEPDQLATSRAVLRLARVATPADGTDRSVGPTNVQIRNLTDVTLATCPDDEAKPLSDVQGQFLATYPDDYLVP